ERVPLPGQAEQETQMIVLDRDRKEPVPAAGAGTAEEALPTAQPAAVVAEPPPAVEQTRVAAAQRAAEPEIDPEDVQPAPAPATKPVASISQTGMWAVQLGSFGSQENAERLAADLRKQGFAAFLSQLPTDAGPLHRVRIGPQKDRDSAEAMAERLAKAGHKGQVVPHP
ncbi:MAG: SPOR domain-containing protein, partial [Gammaproteobacteria bacterium]|nr:SPOR domain-containing protein [Gammaproteobacteria bacterium]